MKIQEQLQLLQQQYDDSVAQLEQLKQKQELTITRLERASVLTAALAQEQVRAAQVHSRRCVAVANRQGREGRARPGLIAYTAVASVCVFVRDNLPVY